ncbi:MAG: glutamate racemase [Myxococcota bacterium]|nr:glutamate racemase [Myxococcota bacterium]MEC8423586.1 glutamate racemase [Myxococcota bacterium]
MKRIDLPIGVFDSGVGGLTVLDALHRRLPGEDLLYLGDTARVPYGTRAPGTVVRYAHRVAGHLVRRGVKAIVIACNTATTWALDALEGAAAPLGLPVIGVIAPGVERALSETRTDRVAVIGTEGTIRGGAYERHLLAARPGIQVRSVPCPLFVSLAEEGWTDGPIARLTAERYLAPLRRPGTAPDTLILGCTHYPLLRGVIADALPGVHLIDSATAAADATASSLSEANLLRARSTGGTTRFLVTDHADRFRRVGARFLQHPPEPVELVDLSDADDAALPHPLEASA